MDGQLPKGFPEGLPSLPGGKPIKTKAQQDSGGRGVGPYFLRSVGFIGFAAIGHLSGQKDYAIHSHLSPPSALAIKRLLLGSFQMEEIKVYI